MQILFVSKYNQLRSKVAEAFFNKFNKTENLSASSAGVFRGGPSSVAAHEMARKYRLILKTTQAGLSTHLLARNDLIVLVGDDVPVTLFTRDNPYVKTFVKWSLSLPDKNDEEGMVALFTDLEHKIKQLLRELGQEKKKVAKIDKILADLKRQGDDETVAAWQSIGMSGHNYFGVSLTDLKAMARRLGKDSALAQQLWRSKNHDARLLATLIIDPLQITEHQTETWLRQADFWDITDKISTEIISKTDFGERKVKIWIRERNDNIRRTGWILIDRFARQKDSGITNQEFERYLGYIEGSIRREKDWVKEAMLYAIIGIGLRNEDLHQRAMMTAGRIGYIEIDYGPGYQAPNPLRRLQRAQFE